MRDLENWKDSGEYFDFRGHRIFYKRAAGQKKTLLCLHGFPTSSYDYHKIWHELSEHFSLLSFDMIGYGFSGKPRDFSYTTFDQADLLEELISNLKIDSLNLLTHDYGNTVTQEILARKIDRGLDFDIESICFLNGALFPETHRPILAQKLLISPIGFLFGRLIPQSQFQSALSSVFGSDTQPSDKEMDEFMYLFNYNGGRRISYKLIRYMRERSLNRERWVGALESIDQPFRFINGLDDPVSGRHLVKRFRELLPDLNDIIELEGIGHFPHFEKPDLVLRHFLEFHSIDR